MLNFNKFQYDLISKRHATVWDYRLDWPSQCRSRGAHGQKYEGQEIELGLNSGFHSTARLYRGRVGRKVSDDDEKGNGHDGFITNKQRSDMSVAGFQAVLKYWDDTGFREHSHA